MNSASQSVYLLFESFIWVTVHFLFYISHNYKSWILYIHHTLISFCFRKQQWIVLFALRATDMESCADACEWVSFGFTCLLHRMSTKQSGCKGMKGECLLFGYMVLAVDYFTLRFVKETLLLDCYFSITISSNKNFSVNCKSSCMHTWSVHVCVCVCVCRSLVCVSLCVCVTRVCVYIIIIDVRECVIVCVCMCMHLHICSYSDMESVCSCMHSFRVKSKQYMHVVCEELIWLMFSDLM